MFALGKQDPSIDISLSSGVGYKQKTIRKNIYKARHPLDCTEQLTLF